MKKIIALLFLISIGITLSAQEFKGNFTKIDASFIYDIEIVKGDKCSVIMVCPEKMEKYVNVKIENNTLKLHHKKGVIYNESNTFKKNIKIYIKMPLLTDLDLKGMADLTSIGNFKADDFKINLSGMSNIKYLNITCKNATISISEMSDANKIVISSDKLDIDISGMSNAEIEGYTKDIQIDVTEMSDFKGKNLLAETGHISVSGMSDATTSIKQIKKVKTNGMSGFKNNYGNIKSKILTFFSNLF